MEDNLLFFLVSDIECYINEYVILWGINIVMVIVIYVIGRIVVGFIFFIFCWVMVKFKYDVMLVDFLEVIISVILMFFVIVVLLD